MDDLLVLIQVALFTCNSLGIYFDEGFPFHDVILRHYVLSK